MQAKADGKRAKLRKGLARVAPGGEVAISSPGGLGSLSLITWRNCARNSLRTHYISSSQVPSPQWLKWRRMIFVHITIETWGWAGFRSIQGSWCFRTHGSVSLTFFPHFSPPFLVWVFLSSSWATPVHIHMQGKKECFSTLLSELQPDGSRAGSKLVKMAEGWGQSHSNWKRMGDRWRTAACSVQTGWVGG